MLRPPLERLAFDAVAGFAAVVDAVVTGGAVRFGATLLLLLLLLPPPPQPATPAASTVAMSEYRRTKRAS
jgi:hypothetical protein